jgi:Mlc titration factor MtfA (ptsG expression regulator)
MKLKPWQYVAFPLGFVTAVFLLLSFLVSDKWAYALVVPFILLAISYVMSPQIDWWWYRRNPPVLNPLATKMLDEHFGYYQKLLPEIKQRFRERLALLLLSTEFMRPPRHEEKETENTVPEDLRIAALLPAVQLWLGKSDFLLGKFEKFVLYPHPFLSIQYPDDFHTAETYEPDGVVLLSAAQLMSALEKPQQSFNIGLYELAVVFRFLNPSVAYPKLDSEIWASFEQISRMNLPFVQAWLGLKEPNLWAVAVHHFFTFPTSFQMVLPDVFMLMTNIFNQELSNDKIEILKY